MLAVKRSARGRQDDARRLLGALAFGVEWPYGLDLVIKQLDAWGCVRCGQTSSSPSAEAELPHLRDQIIAAIPRNGKRPRQVAQVEGFTGPDADPGRAGSGLSAQCA